MKDFYAWNEKKIKIDGHVNYRHPKEREIWWCSIGLNVGTEIYGKGEDFARPVLIINSKLGNCFIGVPLTSKIKSREYSCVVIVKDNVLSTVLVSQIRNFDKRRLRKKIGRISKEEYMIVQRCLLNIIAPFGAIGSYEQERQPLH